MYGLNLFEKLPRKLHAGLLILGGIVSIDLAAMYFMLRNEGGIFGLVNVDTVTKLGVPQWLIEFHKTPVGLWFHITILTVIGLGVIWEGIKYWKTGK